MLPDFIHLKQQITRDREATLSLAQRNQSFLSLVGHVRHYEGDGFTIIRADGSRTSSKYRRFEVGGSLQVSDLESSGTQAIGDLLATMPRK